LSSNKRISKIKLEQNILKKSQRYFKKWLEYTLEDNSAQSKRQFNRLIKSLNNLDELNPDTAKELINTIELKIPTIRNRLRSPNYE
jgi:hypothetical protein